MTRAAPAQGKKAFPRQRGRNYPAIYGNVRIIIIIARRSGSVYPWSVEAVYLQGQSDLRKCGKVDRTLCILKKKGVGA